MRSRRFSGLGRPSGDTKVSGRRVTCKAPIRAYVEGGSGRSEASPTATLQDTHSVEANSLLKKSLSDRPTDRKASKRSENTANTLQNYGAESSIEAPRGAWRSFSTGC
jgi:hypothetical protein